MPDISHGRLIHEGGDEDTFDEFEDLKELPDRAKITEHEDEMQMYQEETLIKTQFYEMEGNLKKQTGEILTFVEAIRQGLLDLQSGGGEFFDIVSGSRISLEKAAELGFIDGGISEVLNKHHGIHHPDTGASLTLIEAIQIGLYDPDNRQLRDIHTGEILTMNECLSRNILKSLVAQSKLINAGILKNPPMELSGALERNLVNPISGHFTGQYSKESLPLKDALYHGYVQIINPHHRATLSMSLTDVIAQELINANNGEFEDRNSSDKFTLRDAISKQNNLINLNVPEVINTVDNTRITLGQAVVSNAVSSRNGNFTDLQSRRTMSLKDAYKEDLICKPLTLTEMHERDAIDSTGHFIDRGTKHRLTLLEAIAAGLLDAEARHIVDQEEQEVVSIAAALERGLLTPDSKIILEKQQKEYSINEAVREGLLTKRARHTIFDIKGIKNTLNDNLLSFNEAVEAGALNVQAERVTDLATGTSHSLNDRAAAKRIIDESLLENLTKPIGINGSENLSLLRAASKGIIDPTKGVFFNKGTKHELSIRDAYYSGLVTLRGALQVGGLLDVHPSLVAPIRRIDKKKRISRPGQEAFAADQVKVTLAEAMKQGLIDSRTQRFRQGDIDMSLDDALTQGLIDPSSEWIVPSKASGAAGPTIEEKTSETVTETGQQLAPKYFPDKNIEESVTTVKRVRTTETSAVGGPGGVSVYRAITGGKGALEVPADGYHIYEAERKGVIDLSEGTITVPNVDRTISFAEGIELGVIDSKTISVVDPRSRRTLNVKEALETNVLDKNGRINGQSIEKAIEARSIIIDAEPLVPVAGKKVIQFTSGTDQVISFRPVGQPVVEEHEEEWSFDATKGVFVDKSTGETMGLDRALASGKLLPEDLNVEDAHTGRKMTFTEAEKWGIIDSKNKYYVDKRDNKRLSFTEAARDHRIYPTGGVSENAADAVHTTVRSQTRTFVTKKEALAGGKPVGTETSLAKALSLGQFDSNTGKFALPEAGKDVSLKEAIIKAHFNPYDTSVIDKRSGKSLSLLEAIQEGIVDDTSGTVLDTVTGIKHDLRSALERGLIKTSSVADSFDFHSKALPPASSSSSGPSRSTRIVEQKLQLTPFAPPTPANGSTQVAFRGGQRSGDGRQEVVDLGGGKQAVFKVVRGEGGREFGEYTDPSTGMKYTINAGGDPYVTETKTTVKSTQQVQSVELEPHAEFVGIDKIRDKRNNRIMSLEDAKRMGLAKVDRKGKQQTKTYSAFRSNVQNAVTKGVVDAHDDKISLEDAIRAGIIDIENLTYVNVRTKESVPLAQASNMGLVDVTLSEALPMGVANPANSEKITISRAIQLGIIDPRTGKVQNPFTKERLSWLDLLRPVYDAITSEGIYDPTKGYRVPVVAAINEGLISHGRYHNPITGEYVELEEAANKGLIDRDTLSTITKPFLAPPSGGRQLNLIEAVEAKLVDPKNRTIQLSRNSVAVPISKAIQDGRIPSDIGEKLRRVDKMTFADALGKGHINVVANTFTDPDTGRQMSIEQAIAEGHIDTANVQAAEGSDDKNLTNIINSDEFDENSGRIRDKKSGLYLTFKQAVERDVIDGDSLLHDLESGQTMTIREAVNRQRIDSEGYYIEQKSGQRIKLRKAVELGLLALIGSPMEAAQAVTEAVKRREKEGYKFKIENLSEGGLAGTRFSQPKIREESTVYKLSSPHRGEPGLSVRLRSTETTSAPTDRARSIIDDPAALADLQNDFLSNLESQQFNVDDRLIENPTSHQRVSIREAAESGLLDVLTGEIVDPSSGNRYSIPRAVRMHLVGSDVGRKLMEGLNLSIEEIADRPPSSRNSRTVELAPAEDGQTKTWTKTISWSGKPEDIRRSGGDILEKYTTYTSSSNTQGDRDAPSWARNQ